MMCRSRMVPVKANFRSAHTSVGCRGCGYNDIEESQRHLLRCPRLNNNSVTANSEDRYEDLFSTNAEKNAIISRQICSQNNRLQALLSAPGDLQDMDASTAESNIVTIVQGG